jgi:cytochrome c oxidase assembly protein subunit 15
MAPQRVFHGPKIVFLSIADPGGGKKVPKLSGMVLLSYLCAAMVSSTTSLRPERVSSGPAGTSRPVAIWVYTGVIMLLIQVILGGITRLTGSGLSITEWNVVTGTLPPLNAQQWQEAFDKYRQTPQFQIINSGFGLPDFKFIFFWEWFHRFWARMVGVVFLVGFAMLLWRRLLQPRMIRPLLILFLLGALQGAVGWIMVASGLTGDAIYVRPTRLALHFIFALGLIVYAFWFALQLSVPESARLGRNAQADNPQRPGPARTGLDGDRQAVFLRQVTLLRHWTIAILAVLIFQLLYGALMAGHKAANVAPTWPTINGDWWPGSLFSQHPLLQDLAGNKITVQFIHRGLAYGLLVLALIWTAIAYRLSAERSSGLSGNASGASAVPPSFRKLRWLPLLLIGVQILLGIFSLLTSPGIIPNHWVTFDWLAQFHQVTGLLFLMTMTGMLYLVIPDRP